MKRQHHAQVKPCPACRYSRPPRPSAPRSTPRSRRHQPTASNCASLEIPRAPRSCEVVLEGELPFSCISKRTRPLQTAPPQHQRAGISAIHRKLPAPCAEAGSAAPSRREAPRRHPHRTASDAEISRTARAPPARRARFLELGASTSLVERPRSFGGGSSADASLNSCRTARTARPGLEHHEHFAAFGCGALRMIAEGDIAAITPSWGISASADAGEAEIARGRRHARRPAARPRPSSYRVDRERPTCGCWPRRGR